MTQTSLNPPLEQRLPRRVEGGGEFEVDEGFGEAAALADAGGVFALAAGAGELDLEAEDALGVVHDGFGELGEVGGVADGGVDGLLGGDVDVNTPISIPSGLTVNLYLNGKNLSHTEGGWQYTGVYGIINNGALIEECSAEALNEKCESKIELVTDSPASAACLYHSKALV